MRHLDLVSRREFVQHVALTTGFVGVSGMARLPTLLATERQTQSKPDGLPLPL
jgi:hypothetical protein